MLKSPEGTEPDRTVIMLDEKLNGISCLHFLRLNAVWVDFAFAYLGVDNLSTNNTLRSLSST